MCARSARAEGVRSQNMNPPNVRVREQWRGDELGRLFDLMDAKENKAIKAKDLKQLFKDQDKAQFRFDAISANKSGDITRDEFVKFYTLHGTRF